MLKHPMLQALREMKGNPKACILTEPLWGIPNSLYLPFVSVFMLAIGANDIQVGLVSSLTLFIRAVASVISGVVTDKFGRKRTTFFVDFFCWSIPCLLWTFSQNIWWFYLAALFNGFWQITDNSWTCLLVEDADKKQMVHIYSWIYFSGQLSVFFAPIAGLLVGNLGLVLAMRILYGFSFVSMSAKFILLYRYCSETSVGEVRMRETKGLSIFTILGGYKELIPRFFMSRDMRLAVILSILMTVIQTVINNFFGIFATTALLIPDSYLAYFPIIRSAIMLTFILLIQSRIIRFGYKAPMLIGIVLYIASHLLLIFLPGKGLAAPLIYTVMEACAYGLVMPRKDSLVALCLDAQERARMTSIMTVAVLGVAIPFGYISGLMSKIDRRLPFLLNIGIFIVAFIIIFSSKRLSKENTVS